MTHYSVLQRRLARRAARRRLLRAVEWTAAVTGLFVVALAGFAVVVAVVAFVIKIIFGL